MKHQISSAELHNSLQIIIEKMQRIQSRISGSSQPASMHELDALKKLGQQYSDVIESLQGE